MDVSLMPFEVARSIGNTIRFQTSLDLQKTCPFQVLPVDAADDFCLLRVNDQVAFRILGVA